VVSEEFMEHVSHPSLTAIRVLVADSNQMECQLLVSALRERPEFQVTCCARISTPFCKAILPFPAQIAIINVDHPGMNHTI